MNTVKTIVITGAGKGIGFAAARLFAEQGHRVIALSRTITALETEAAKHSNLIPLSFDLLTPDFNLLKNFFESNKIGHVDALINNAGFLVNKPFTDISDAELERSYQVNVFAPYKLIRFFTSYLSQSGAAHVVNISSMGGFQGSQKFPGLSAYSSSKAALAGLTECLAEEFRDSSISFNCLCLGAVQTEMLTAAFPGYKAPVSADEMAQFLVNFTLENHRFMNGKIIPVALSTP